LLGRVLADRQPMNSRERNTAYALGWSAFLAILAGFVLMVLHFSKPING